MKGGKRNLPTFFNRREPAAAMEMWRQAEMRNILAACGVKYLVRIRSPGGGSFGSRGRRGGFAPESARSFECRRDVHEDDYAGTLSQYGH